MVFVLTQQMMDGQIHYIEQMFLSQGTCRLGDLRAGSFPAGDRISPLMARSTPTPLAPKLHLILNAAGLLIAAALMAFVARGTGLSALRLVIISATAMLALAFMIAAIHLNSHAALERRVVTVIGRHRNPLRIGLDIAFLAFWCLTWLPPQYTGEAYYYFIGLYPLILCGLLFTGSALLLIVLPGNTGDLLRIPLGDKRAEMTLFAGHALTVCRRSNQPL